MTSRVNIFLTIDTELRIPNEIGEEGQLQEAIFRDIYGKTQHGEFGLVFQLELLKKYNIKASFFVEPFCHFAIGFEELSNITRTIQTYGQDIQLHIHPGWLKYANENVTNTIAPFRYMKNYSLQEQVELIQLGKSILADCNVNSINAFRAGAYAANLNTLKALAINGITYDTSYNFCYSENDCAIKIDTPISQPAQINGVIEIPISYFGDYRNHYRHTQLSACSFDEFKFALEEAYQKHWASFVIVSHSFELINRRLNSRTPPSVDMISVKRMNKLCQYLNQNRNKYNITCFTETSSEKLLSLSAKANTTLIQSDFRRTAKRFIEQFLRRIQQ